MDEYRAGLVKAIEGLERGIAERQARLDFLRRQLTEYDAQGFKVADFQDQYPRDAAPLLLAASGPMTARDTVAALLEGGVKVGGGRPEINVKMALTILVKSGKLWLNGADASGQELSVQDNDLLSAPPPPPPPSK